MTSKRNLHSSEVLLLIRGGSDCLFLRQTTVYDAMLLPRVSPRSLLNTIFHIEINKVHGKTFSHMVEVIRDFCEKVFPSGLAEILEL